MKVLWFSNIDISEGLSGTGSWIFAMANCFINSDSVQLYNITQAKVKRITRKDYKFVSQWFVPFDYLGKKGLPKMNRIREIQRIVYDIRPDIIHIWGTENYWGLLTARGYLKGNVILEIQGFKFAIEKYFYGGLSISEIFNCLNIKELIKPSVSLFRLKHSFKKWGKYEKEMLLHHKVISTQSDWVRAYIKSINPASTILNTYPPLRDEFNKAKKWDINSCVKYRVFTSASSSSPYKGLHILFDAIAILKDRYPQITLNIAGRTFSGFREGGYSKWLRKKINYLKIEKNIFWLGALDSKEIIQEMWNANVVVIPSFVESYCLALEEALTIGVPSVVSFAGAMPELAVHNETTLFFPSGDYNICASYISKLFDDEEFAQTISSNAFKEKESKKSSDRFNFQLSVYNQVLLNQMR